MNKKICSIVIAIVLLFSFCSCSKTENANGDFDNMNGIVKVNIPYRIREVMSVGISSSAINKEYGKADISRQNNQKSYEIRNMDDESKLIVIYTIDKNRITDIWQLKTLIPKKDFELIIPDSSSVKDIIKIDEYTNIFQLSDDKAISEHRLSNNEIAIIFYTKKNNDWIVQSIEYSLDSSDFINTLTDEDKKMFIK